MDALVSSLRKLAEAADSQEPLSHGAGVEFLCALRNAWPALLSRIEAGEKLAEALECLDICASFGCGYDAGRDMILHDEGCANIRTALSAFSAAKGGGA